MTAILVVRLRGHGAVLVSDGRVKYDSAVLRETYTKYVSFPGGVVAFAGSGWPPRRLISESKGWADLENRSASWALERGQADKDDDVWAGLGYDTRAKRVKLVDPSGDSLVLGSVAAIGTGGDVAYGAYVGLTSGRKPAGLEQVAEAARAAVRVACKRDADCGGRVRVVVVSDKDGSVLEVESKKPRLG